jgi:hypothetical protein
VQTGSDNDQDDSAFFTRKNAAANNSDVLTQYLNSTSDETTSIKSWPELKEIFIKLNTPIPSSASAERLFSCAGLVMTNKRTRMTDKLFENLVFLKMNMNML